MNHLTVSTRTSPDGPVVELAGDLDHATAPQVRDALQRLQLREGQQLIVDLGGLTFCDSSGITVLIAARNYALQSGGGIALAAVPDRVVRMFRMVGLGPVFVTHPTVQEAAAAWRSPSR